MFRCFGPEASAVMYGRLISVCWLRRQLDLGLFRSFFQALHRQRVFAHIDAGFFLELIRQKIDDADVEVFAAQEGVAIGGQHFKLAFAIDFGDFDDGHVEGTATQVIHGNLAVTALLVHAVSQRCGSRFVDDALDVKAGNTAGIFGCLALRIVEISRYGDDCFGNRFAEEVLSGLFHLHQHACRNFRW